MASNIEVDMINQYFTYRYVRFLSPNYGDGFSSPTLAVSGDELPSARLTSNKVFTELSVLDQNLTLLNMQWGQSVSHDMSLLAGSTSSSNYYFK